MNVALTDNHLGLLGFYGVLQDFEVLYCLTDNTVFLEQLHRPSVRSMQQRDERSKITRWISSSSQDITQSPYRPLHIAFIFTYGVKVT